MLLLTSEFGTATGGNTAPKQMLGSGMAPGVESGVDVTQQSLEQP